MKLLLFLAIYLIVEVNGNHLGRVAPFITPCHQSDQVCLKVSAQRTVPILAAGVPSLGLPPMDPLQLEQVETTVTGLNADFRNSVIKGLRKCKVRSLSFQDNRIKLEVMCTATMEGDYTFSGKLLYLIPVQSDGRYKITFQEMVAVIEMDVVDKMYHGETYWDIVSWQGKATSVANVKFEFENLYQGNVLLSTIANAFLNFNWRLVYAASGTSIVNVAVGQVVDIVKMLFDKVPVDQLTLDNNHKTFV